MLETIRDRVTLDSLQLAFAQQNSNSLSELSFALLGNHMLTPLAVQAHSLLGQLLGRLAGCGPAHAFGLATWSARVVGPVRLTVDANYTPPSVSPAYLGPVEATVIAQNSEFVAFCEDHPLEKHTEDMLYILLNEVSLLPRAKN